MRDVIVVGAGAAGLAAAIFARRFNPSRSVAVVDGARKPGAKILVSGGSRCNVTNTVVTDRDFWGGRPSIVRRILRAFSASDTVRFFQELGITLHEEAGGKLFPDTNRSRDVLNALLREIDARGVELLAEHRVTDVVRSAGHFVVMTNRGPFEARTVVLATGGKSLPKTGSDGAGYDFARSLGHTIVPTTPALAPLLLDVASIHAALAGVSHDVEVAVWLDGAVSIRITGSVLWTHFGVSGPVALDASRHWSRGVIEGRRVAVTMNFCPGNSFDAIDGRVLDAAAETPKASILTFVSQLVPASVGRALLQRLSIDTGIPLAHLPRDARRQLARALAEWPLPVAGTRGYGFAEATAGGVALDEIDPRTMESRKCQGLFLVGEMLDVDGRIGGFNFQWAWSTGFVAGRGLGGC